MIQRKARKKTREGNDEIQPEQKKTIKQLAWQTKSEQQSSQS
jgi:hypothetical protein